ncbi:hypothetical protein COV82_00640 [Candidatus Peregrinibacteria bacterium CG11_big_fil_rev_8_21_14_0_20_46_8]|nr:MAG: hypothetical protein COV82_00640 [Candidatus Peregrinibacteria bacterium CG11_big_fil_rev_8_21_14_0_20_46_8]
MLALELFIIAGLILLNGYFSLSEIALLSVKKSRLKHLSKQGNKQAEKALFLVHHSSEMLSTIQIAITTIGIFAGAFGGATIAEYIANWLEQYPSFADYGEPIGVALVVLVITYFSLIIGELVPKQIALSNAEKMSLKVAGTITSLMRFTKPLVVLVSTSTKKFLKLLHVKAPTEQTITEEEIKVLIAEGTEKGVFEKTEQKMVENVFHLGNRPIKDFMTPNNEVVWLDLDDPITIIKNKIITSDKSIFLVYKGRTDHPIGAIETNDILTHVFTNESEELDLKSLIQPVMNIHADVPSLVAIDRLKKSSISMALVTDKETKKPVGVISFHDVLEAIIGEFKVEY